MPAKRFAHKRAFVLHGMLVELLLVEPDAAGPVTWFWGELPLRWRQPLAAAAGPLPLASADNLRLYRQRHRSLEPWRWRDPRSRV